MNEELLDQVIEAATFMVDAGLRSDRLHDPEAMANYAKAALIIASNRGCENYLLKAAEAWVIEGNKWCPTASELASKASIVHELLTLSIGIEVGGQRGPAVAIMKVDRRQWESASQEQRNRKIEQFCLERGLSLLALPAREG